jgi:hypothetical protein
MEIKKIDSDAVIGAVLTDNGKAYSCRTKKGNISSYLSRIERKD